MTKYNLTISRQYALNCDAEVIRSFQKYRDAKTYFNELILMSQENSIKIVDQGRDYIECDNGHIFQIEKVQA